jgi:hypothetical protein
LVDVRRMNPRRQAAILASLLVVSALLSYWVLGSLVSGVGSLEQRYLSLQDGNDALTRELDNLTSQLDSRQIRERVLELEGWFAANLAAYPANYSDSTVSRPVCLLFLSPSLTNESGVTATFQAWGLKYNLSVELRGLNESSNMDALIQFVVRGGLESPSPGDSYVVFWNGRSFLALKLGVVSEDVFRRCSEYLSLTMHQ